MGARRPSRAPDGLAQTCELAVTGVGCCVCRIAEKICLRRTYLGPPCVKPRGHRSRSPFISSVGVEGDDACPVSQRHRRELRHGHVHGHGRAVMWRSGVPVHASDPGLTNSLYIMQNKMAPCSTCTPLQAGKCEYLLVLPDSCRGEPLRNKGGEFRAEHRRRRGFASTSAAERRPCRARARPRGGAMRIENKSSKHCGNSHRVHRRLPAGQLLLGSARPLGSAAQRLL